MNTGLLQMFHDRPDQDLLAITGRIHVQLGGVAKVFVDQKRAIWREEGLGQVGIELGLVAEDLHATSAQDVRRANEHREADGLDRFSHVVRRCARRASRHPKANT